MDWFPYSLVLVPPGTIIASVESYRKELFPRYGDLLSQALTPGIRLGNYRSIPEHPGEIRLEKAIVFTPPQTHKGLLYLPMTPKKALDSLRSVLPGGRGGSALQPLTAGIPLCRIGEDPEPPAFDFKEELMRSGSLTLFCFAYQFQFDSREELIGLEEREIWHQPVRKALAGNGKKR